MNLTVNRAAPEELPQRPDRFADHFLIRKDETFSFVVALCLVALAKMQSALNLGYAVDDYQQTLDGLSSIADSLIRQGRFGELWLSNAFNLIGYEPARAPLLSILLSIVLSVWTANAVMRLWQVEVPNFTRALCIFVIAAHPYTAEIFTFRGIAVYHLIAFALAFLGIVMARPGVVGILVPAFIVSAALTIYQVPLSYIAAFLIIDMVIRILRHLLNDGKTWREYIFEPVMVARLAVLVVGVVLYFVWLKLSTWGLPPHPRSVLIDPGDVPGRLSQAFRLVAYHFATGRAYATALVPPPVLAIVLILTLVAIGEFFLRARSSARGLLGIAVILAGLVGAALAVLGLPLIAKALMLPPRALAQIGIVWAGVAVIVLLVGRRWAQMLATALLCVATISFTAISQQMFVDNTRMNTRDHNLVLRLLGRLEAMSDFPAVTTIAVVGTRTDDAPMPTATHTIYGFNNSSFSGWWSIAPMFTEMSGRKLKSPNGKDRERASAYCKTRAPWPAIESVTIDASLAIVCLSN